MTQILIAMRGYPGAGKTTLARQLKKEHDNLVVVSSDDLRYMMYQDYRPGRDAERLIKFVETSVVRKILYNKMSVIVDGCNLHYKSMDRFAIEALRFDDVEFEILDVKTPIEECITRDETRPSGEHRAGRRVIENMVNKYPMSEWVSADEIWEHAIGSMEAMDRRVERRERSA